VIDFQQIISRAYDSIGASKSASFCVNGAGSADCVDRVGCVDRTDCTTALDSVGCNGSILIDSNYNYVNQNLIVTSDNIAAINRLILDDEMSRVDMVYMDPPFYSSSDYYAKVPWEKNRTIEMVAYRDKLDLESYLVDITASIISAKQILKDTGSLWIHLDHHIVHYIKVIADEIFGGQDHFINEIIWQYKSGGAGRRSFSRKHDTILFYAKDPKKYKFFPIKEKSYNRQGKPYRFKGVEEFSDEHGYYTMVNAKDVWEIPMVGRTSAERTGYPTQKPQKLLEKMILSATSADDIVLDLYGGSGAVAACAYELGRRFISIDCSDLSALFTMRRLEALPCSDYTWIRDAKLPYARDDEILSLIRNVADRAMVAEAMSSNRSLLSSEMYGLDIFGRGSILTES
jgi:DNA modification methylase